MKKILTLFTVLFLGTLLSAQSVMVAPYGVSPREATDNETDIFDLAYNGLTTVGVQTQMYLLGSSDAALSGQIWTLSVRPSSSSAVLGAATAMDANSEIVIFKPDVGGKYEIIFTSNGISDTLSITAGLYLGNGGGSVGCILCHSSKADQWEGTGHATALTRGLDGMKGDHFSSRCVSCHTTGYDENADNDGFDDFEFVFPAELKDGVADVTTKKYPDAMARANIQCESCHGAGSQHFGDITSISTSLSDKVCAYCHDSGTHHVYPDQWKYSGHDATEFDERGFHGGHAIGAFVGYAGGRSGCSPCHSGSGYLQWDKEGKPTDDLGLPAATSILPSPELITCAICHDPHDATEAHQLRLSDTQLGDGTPITAELYGNGAQCMECHRSRRYAAEYTLDPSNGSSHYGPHHGPQADMLIGANAPDFGIKLPTSPHALQGNACVDCHMAENAENLHIGGHSFNMNDADGNDNLEACAPCHGEIGESFKEKKFYFNGNADHDGDGIEEGLQEEVEGMLEELATFLPQDNNGNVDMSGKDHEVKVYKAGYTYMWVEEDRSFGIHNPAYTVGLLKAAIELMKYEGFSAGKIMNINDIPMDQGLQVRIVWTAFGADDGVAQDAVEKYLVYREAPVGLKTAGNVATYSSVTEIPASTPMFKMNGELWEQVAEIAAVQFKEYAAVVPTLYNSVKGDTVWTNFKVIGQSASGMLAETEPMAGYSTDDLAPMAPANLMASADGSAASLTWEMNKDKDLNHYKVYRNGEEIGTTVKAEFVDNNVEAGGEYTYYVTAADHSKNESKISNKVTLTITDIAMEDGIPTKYALGNNYPNPFNPSTNIKFALPQSGQVRLVIYDATGKVVNTLVDRQLSAGNYQYTWNATNVATGVYFYRIEAGSFVSTKKMLLIK